ncbi:MAG: hypothetical protein NVSMB59_11540 [Vulcanimicrobiaceae bacterium]
MNVASQPNARVLATDAGVSASERLADYLPADERAAALSVAEAAVLVVDAAGPHVDRLADTLRAHGGYARADAARLVFAGTRGTLATAREVRAGDAEAATLAGELVRAFDASRARSQCLRLRDRSLDLGTRARVMGILNVTPDSFHDSGRYAGVDRARARAAEMVRLGADLIDIGGQSYAHWNPRIAADDERERVVPVVRALLADGLDVPLSIDTFKASVAEAALDAGAHLINDCSGLSDARLAAVVARYDAGLVVMHLKGELNVRAAAYSYDDALAEIATFLRDRIEIARAAGVGADAIAIDPGLEFGKEPTTDLEILERFGDLRSLGYPMLFAASRKSFIGRVFDRPSKELLVPSLATAALGIVAGATLVRVHDVAETVALATMLGAVRRDARARLAIVAAMPGTPAAT